MKDIIKITIQMLGFAFVLLFTFSVLLFFIIKLFDAFGIVNETAGVVLVLSALVISILAAFAFLHISDKFSK